MKKTNLKIIFTLALLLTIEGCSPNHQEQKKARISENIEQIITKYPLITLSDIYKGYFQDYLGPSHLIPDSKTARLFIEKELQEADTLYGDYYTPCGWQGNYYRVNLRMIREGKISSEKFAQAFCASATGVDSALVAKWRDEWNETVGIISGIASGLEGFKRDSTAIAQMLERGEYVVHHSTRFNEAYHPHYRIIKREIFEKEILPLLK